MCYYNELTTDFQNIDKILNNILEFARDSLLDIIDSTIVKTKEQFKETFNRLQLTQIFSQRNY